MANIRIFKGTDSWQHGSFLKVFLGFVLVLFLGGCSAMGSTYYEEQTIGGLHVVFLDEGALHKKWTELSGEKAASFDLRGTSNGGVTLQVVKGFFDPNTETIYCTKVGFEVCKQELHHAVVALQSKKVVAQSHGE